MNARTWQAPTSDDFSRHTKGEEEEQIQVQFKSRAAGERKRKKKRSLLSPGCTQETLESKLKSSGFGLKVNKKWCVCLSVRLSVCLPLCVAQFAPPESLWEFLEISSAARADYFIQSDLIGATTCLSGCPSRAFIQLQISARRRRCRRQRRWFSSSRSSSTQHFH